MRNEIIRILISSVISAIIAIAGLFGITTISGCATLVPHLIDSLIQCDAGVNYETSKITTPEAWP